MIAHYAGQICELAANPGMPDRDQIEGLVVGWQNEYLLAWVPQWMFPDEPLAAFGTTRLVEDIFQLPGRLFFHRGQLTEVHLNRLLPHAEAVAAGLERLLSHFGNP